MCQDRATSTTSRFVATRRPIAGRPAMWTSRCPRSVVVQHFPDLLRPVPCCPVPNFPDRTYPARNCCPGSCRAARRSPAGRSPFASALRFAVATDFRAMDFRWPCVSPAKIDCKKICPMLRTSGRTTAPTAQTNEQRAVRESHRLESVAAREFVRARKQRRRAVRPRTAAGEGGSCEARRPAGIPSGRRGCGDCAG
jgi:hypothetical protein